MLLTGSLFLQAQSGDLDATFNGNGVAIGNYTEDNNSADAMVVQADGKIVVAGGTGYASNIEIGVSRLNTDGTVDTTFGTDGVTLINSGWIKSFVYDMDVQPDGKIVLAGYRWNNETGDFLMVRLNEDGSLDDSFGTNGIAIIDNGETEVAESFTILPDGKFIISGYVFDNFSMIRINHDGTVDTTFGNNGWVITEFGDSSSYSFVTTVNADGRIVLGGMLLGFDNKYKYAAAAYNSDGSLDTSFGTDGKVILNVGNDNDFGIRLIQLEDGKILFGGHSYYGTNPLRYELAVARLNSDGSMDTSYGNNGVFKSRFVTNGESYLADMVLQADGKLVLTGPANESGTYTFGITRATADGQLDTTFGDAGKVITYIDLNNSESFNISLQTDGKILVSGDTYPAGNTAQFFIARYLNDVQMAVQDLNNSTFSLYPNPATSQINLAWTNSNKEYQVEIFNLLGQKVMTSKALNNASIDVSSLAVGTYFVRLSNEGKATTLRFIKK